jgi:hypothetical protein
MPAAFQLPPVPSTSPSRACRRRRSHHLSSRSKSPSRGARRHPPRTQRSRPVSPSSPHLALAPSLISKPFCFQPTPVPSTSPSRTCRPRRCLPLNSRRRRCLPLSRSSSQARGARSHRLSRRSKGPIRRARRHPPRAQSNRPVSPSILSRSLRSLLIVVRSFSCPGFRLRHQAARACAPCVIVTTVRLPLTRFRATSSPSSDSASSWDRPPIVLRGWRWRCGTASASQSASRTSSP